MSQYNVIRFQNGVEMGPCVRQDNQYVTAQSPGVWTSFDAAKAFADQMNRDHAPSTYEVRQVGAEVVTEAWRLREEGRFNREEYKRTPWHDEPWYQKVHEDHWCHVSTREPGKVAFTENDAKGKADRQLAMRPGRYLNRFFSDVLSNEQIEMWCAKLSVALAENALKITQDADEIEAVYLGGPSSCMSYGLSSYDSPVHPTRVYAGPDLAVAYIGSMEDASARAVVWPDKKIWKRTYGDCSRLELLLTREGYTEGSLYGARVRRILHEGRYVVPYIDGGGDLQDDGEYLIIGGGHIESQNTEGLSGSSSWVCPRCDEVEDEDDSRFIHGAGEHWCDSCTSSDASYCHHTDEYWPDSEGFVSVYYRGGGGYVSTVTILERHAGSYGAVYVEGRDQWWAETACFKCDDCGEWFVSTDKQAHEDGSELCRACLDDRPEPEAEDDEPEQHDAHVVTWTVHAASQMLALAA